MADETMEDWRLVPNDNNIGQRSVQLVPGGGGTEGLMRGLHKRVFFAGNPFPRRATMQLQVRLPDLLQSTGWRLRFEGITDDQFVLDLGERQQLTLDVLPGDHFTADQVEASEDRDIAVTLLADGMVLGGMIYRLDPSLEPPANT